MKSVEQQAVLVLHRVRKEVSDQRTALINQLRGMLCEFGMVLPRAENRGQTTISRTQDKTKIVVCPLFQKSWSVPYFSGLSPISYFMSQQDRGKGQDPRTARDCPGPPSIDLSDVTCKAEFGLLVCQWQRLHLA